MGITQRRYSESNESESKVKHSQLSRISFAGFSDASRNTRRSRLNSYRSSVLYNGNQSTILTPPPPTYHLEPVKPFMRDILAKSVNEKVVKHFHESYDHFNATLGGQEIQIHRARRHCREYGANDIHQFTFSCIRGPR